MTRRLPQVDFGLGRPTIMDRTLAEAHGITYVHAAAFAIDVDRVFDADPAEEVLPFGWEVFLTEYQLLSLLDVDEPEGQRLVEDLCLTVLDASPDARLLGSQVAFATYDAVARGGLDNKLSTIFHRWRKPPTELVADLAELWQDPAPVIARCAEHCLEVAQGLDPPMTPPTALALEEMISASSSPSA